jgi:hypothetical protein
VPFPQPAGRARLRAPERWRLQGRETQKRAAAPAREQEQAPPAALAQEQVPAAAQEQQE